MTSTNVRNGRQAATAGGGMARQLAGGVIVAWATLAAFAGVSHAQSTYIWLGGGTDDNWTTGFNWDQFSPPPTSSPVATSIIDSTLAGVVTSTANNPPNYQDGGRLNLQLAGGTLNINNGLWRYGYENFTGANMIAVGGGTVAANLNRNSNSSSPNVFGGASFLMGPRGSSEQAIRVLANGAVKVRAASANPSPFNDVLVGPTFTNNQTANARISLEGGRFDAGSKSIAVGYDQNTQKGTFTFTAGELANVSRYMAISRIYPDYPLGGTFWNILDYTVQTTLLQQGGSIKPGTVTYPGNDFVNAIENPIGSMTVYGNYTQQAAGSLSIDVASLGSFDTMNVLVASGTLGGGTTGGGAVTLAGTLEINLLNGFLPQPGDTFNVLTAATSLDVSNLTLATPGFSFQAVGNTLQVTAVPEPSTLALAGCGAAAAVWAAGRRRRRGA